MSYVISAFKRQRDQLLQFGPGTPADDLARGSALARALQGRYAPGLTGFIMHPSRARKWETLFRGGFSARRVISHGHYVWVFCRNEHEQMILAEATALASSPRIVEVA